MKSLRIYMETAAKVKYGLNFWTKLMNPSLANFLLKEAKKAGVLQAVCLNVRSGFLKGKTLTCFVGEYIPGDFPTVIELIDEEDRLLQFYNSIKFQLRDEVVVLQDFEQIKNHSLNLHKEV